MRSIDHSAMLRDVGLVPTIQRLAILDWIGQTRQHPTADQVLCAVRKKHPTISRATVYNTLDALTKAGMILRLNVDPSVARYDADLGPHAHFRCRVCGAIYDIEAIGETPPDVSADGHLVESIRTYAYGICASCRQKGEPTEEGARASAAPDTDGQDLANQPKDSKSPSAAVPPRPSEKEARSA